MLDIAQVILPVFLVLAAGYIVAWTRLITTDGFDQIMTFAQKIAVPCLLFQGISKLDLGQNFELNLLSAFYLGAVVAFVLGILGARLGFGRSWEDSVAIGFCCLFSNTLMLGLPISERAFGTESLAPNFMIISLHAPVCYAIGVTVMEMMRQNGSGAGAVALGIVRSMARNAMVLGIIAGFSVNLTGLPVPGVVNDAVGWMARSAIPVALFALGGVLLRYRPEGDLRVILMVCGISLLIHPAIVWRMGRWLGLNAEQFRAAIITSAVAPGINAYLFADMYGRARRVAASSVLISTALAMFTVWGWLVALG